MAFKTSEWSVSNPAPTPQGPGVEAAAKRRADAKEKAGRERDQIRSRLLHEGAFDLASKLNRCGEGLNLVCTCCGTNKAVEVQCRRRWCPSCSWVISMKRMERFGGAIKLMEWPLFVTLTQPNSPDPDTIRDLRKSWGKMRRRKLLKESIKGGVASIEVTNRGKGWHAHLHAIVDCRWLALHVPAPEASDPSHVVHEKCTYARHELSAVWGSIIKSPVAVVLAKRAGSAAVASYVLKYATKGSELIECEEPIAPLIRVMDKSRLVSAFGSLHGRTREMDGSERPVVACGNCGSEKTFLPDAVAFGNWGMQTHGNTVPVHLASAS